ncbi:MAG: LruC domain-containing protein [Bacteroidales bacterium]|nr:LruC domain-containing protein [Bacteroidales bacterium]
MKTKKLIYTLFALIFVLAACKKNYYDAEESQNSPNQSANSIFELKVHNNFNWKTSRDISFNISNVPDEIISITSIDKSVVYHKGTILNNSQKYSIKINLPYYLTSVLINNKVVEINGETVEVIFATTKSSNNFTNITRYVSPTGNHTPPFTSLATAANDIQSAIDICVDNDLILVDNGTYVLTNQIQIQKAITLQSINGINNSIIDGNNNVRCIYMDHIDAVVDGFTITKGYNPSGFGGGVNIVSNGAVQNCKITYCQARDGGGIAIDNGGLVQDCIIKNNSADNNSNNGYGGGVRCLNGGIVRNCLITENVSMKYGGGINIWNAGLIQSCIITNNTAPNGAGIRTRNNSIVINTIIYFNNGSNWEVSGSGYIYNNSCSTPALPTGTNNITSDPFFVSIIPGVEDYHFQANSPCIDIGLLEAWMNTATDLDGNPRITNGSVDMGAYEFIVLVTDTDNDGVPDDEDDYPNDPDRAFDIFWPAAGFGTLAFEDLWPVRGDYDFNDLVVDYQFQTVTNASNEVVEIFGRFGVNAIGAFFHNGFGFNLPNANSSLINNLFVEDYNISGNIVNINANGLETGQTYPTIIVFDDAFNILSHPGIGTGVNTEATQPYVESDTVTIKMIPTGTYSEADFAISDYNPFIFIEQTRGRELHLPDYEPTDLADASYYQTWEDDTQPGTGKYFKTINNLPWAINITESFDYPYELIEISEAYLHFIEWAESSGASYPDWFQDNQGYRNVNKIYSPTNK